MKQFLVAGACVLSAAFSADHGVENAAYHGAENTLAIMDIEDTIPSAGPCASYVYLNDAKSFPPEPVYTDEEQRLFWVSPSVAPGENVLIKGAFSNSIKPVRLTYLPPGPKDWKKTLQDHSNGNSVTVNATNINSSGITVKIPDNFPKGVYAFEINRSPGMTGRINLPAIYWTNGYGKQITPGQVKPGDSLIVAGSDFPLKGNLLLIANNQTTTIPYAAEFPNEIHVRIPPGLSTGNMNMIVSPGNTVDECSSDPFSIKVLPPNPDDELPIQTIDCQGLKGDGQTDNSDALINCLNKNRPYHNLVYIKIPNGVFKFSRPIRLLPYQYLVGNSPNTSILKGIAEGKLVPDIWVTGSHHFGIMNLCISGSVKKILFGNFSDLVKFRPDPDTTGHIYIYNSILQCEPQSPYSKGSTVLQIGGPDIQIINTTIDNTRIKASQNLGMYIVPSAGALFNNLQIRLGDWGWNAIDSYHNVLFENSSISGETSTPGASAGISLASNAFQGSSEGILIRNNSFRDIVSNNKEAITTDGTNGAYLGYVQSSTSNRLTLKDNPNWTHVGAFSDKKFIVTITAGRGIGQFRYVAATSGKKLDITQPWDIIPDQTSVVTISLNHRYIDIEHNKFDNTGAAQFYGGVFDSFIVGNEMTGSRGISLYSPLYSCGCLPIQNIIIQSNSILGNDGADTIQTNGFWIRSNYNGSISGVVIRNNQLDPSRRLTFTPGGIPRMQSFLFEKNSGGNLSRLNSLPGKGMRIIPQ